MRKIVLYLGLVIAGFGFLLQAATAETFLEKITGFFDSPTLPEFIDRADPIINTPEEIKPAPVSSDETRQTFFEAVTDFFNSEQKIDQPPRVIPGKFQEFRYAIPFAPEIATITPSSLPDEEINKIVQEQLFGACSLAGNITAVAPVCDLGASSNNDRTYTLNWICKGFRECVIEKNGKQLFSINDNGFVTLPTDRLSAGTRAEDALINFKLRALGNGAQSIPAGQYTVLGASKSVNANLFNPTYSKPQVFDSNGVKVSDSAAASEIYKLAAESSIPPVSVAINANTVNIPVGTQLCAQSVAAPLAPQVVNQCKQVDIPAGAYLISPVRRTPYDTECANCYTVGYGNGAPNPYIIGPDSSQVPDGPILRGVIELAQKEIRAAGIDPLKIVPNNTNPVVRDIVNGGRYKFVAPIGSKTNLIGGLYSYEFITNAPTTSVIQDFKTGLEFIDKANIGSLSAGRTIGITDSDLAKDLKNAIKNIIYTDAYAFPKNDIGQNISYISDKTDSVVRESVFQRSGTAYISPNDCTKTNSNEPPRCKKQILAGSYKVIPKTIQSTINATTKLSFVQDSSPSIGPVIVFDASGNKVTDLDVAREVIRIANESIWQFGMDPRSIVFSAEGTQLEKSFAASYSAGYPVVVPTGVTTDPVRGYFKIYPSTEVGSNPPPETRLIYDLYKGSRVVDPEVVRAIWDISQKAQTNQAGSTQVGAPTGNEKIEILTPADGGEISHSDPILSHDPTRLVYLKWKVSGVTSPKDYKVVIRDTYTPADSPANEPSFAYPVQLTSPTPNTVLTLGVPTRISWKGGRERVNLYLAGRDLTSVSPYSAYGSVYFPATTPYLPYITSVNTTSYGVFGGGLTPSVPWDRAERALIAKDLPPNGSFVWDGKTLCDHSGASCVSLETLVDRYTLKSFIDENLRTPGLLSIVAGSAGGLAVGRQVNCGMAFVGSNICNSSFTPVIIEKTKNSVSRQTVLSTPVVAVTADIDTALWNRGMTYDFGKHALEAQLIDKANRIVARDLLTVNAVVPKIEILSPLPGQEIDITKPVTIRWRNRGFDSGTQLSVLLTEFLNADYYKNPWLPDDTNDQVTHQNLPLFVSTNLIRPDGSFSNRVEAGDGSATINLLDSTYLLKRSGVVEKTTLRQFLLAGGKLKFPLISIAGPTVYSGVVTSGVPVTLTGDPNVTSQITNSEVEFWVSKVDGVVNAAATVAKPCYQNNSYEKCYKYTGQIPANRAFTVSWKIPEGFAGCSPYQGGALRKDGAGWSATGDAVAPYYPSSGEATVFVPDISGAKSTIFLGLQCGKTFREGFPAGVGRILEITNQFPGNGSAPAIISPLPLSFRLVSVESESSPVGFSDDHITSFPVLKAILKGKKFTVAWNASGATRCDFTGSKVPLARGGYWNEVVNAAGSGQETLIATDATPVPFVNAGNNAVGVMLTMRCYDNNGNPTKPADPANFISLRFSTVNTVSLLARIKNVFAGLFANEESGSRSALAQLFLLSSLPVNEADLKYAGVTAVTSGSQPWIYITDKDVPQNINSRSICSPAKVSPPPLQQCKAVSSGSYTIFGVTAQPNSSYIKADFDKVQVFGPDRTLVADQAISDYVYSIYRSAPAATVNVPVSGTNVFVPSGTPICSAVSRVAGIVDSAVPASVTPTVAEVVVKSSTLQATEALWFKNQDSAAVSGSPLNSPIIFTLPSYATNYLGTKPVIKKMTTQDIGLGSVPSSEARLRLGVKVQSDGAALVKQGEKLKLQYAIGTGWGSTMYSNLLADSVKRSQFLSLFSHYYTRAYAANCSALTDWQDVGATAVFKDNPGVNNGAVPLPSAFGPSGILQTYVERNPFRAENQTVSVNSQTVFDFSLKIPGFRASQAEREKLTSDGEPMLQSKVDYMCFRIAKEDGSLPIDEGIFPVIWRNDAEFRP